MKTEAELVRNNDTKVTVSNITGWLAAFFTLMWLAGLFVLVCVTFLAVTGAMNVSATLIFSVGVSGLVSVLIGSILWLINVGIEENIKNNRFVSSKCMLSICGRVSPYTGLKAELDRYVNVRPYLTLTEYRDFSREVRKMKRGVGDDAYLELWAEHHRCDAGDSVA